MTALCILKMDLHDPEAFKEYMATAPQTVIQYGGRHFSRGGRTATLEGDENTVRSNSTPSRPQRLGTMS